MAKPALRLTRAREKFPSHQNFLGIDKLGLFEPIYLIRICAPSQQFIDNLSTRVGSPELLRRLTPTALGRLPFQVSPKAQKGRPRAPGATSAPPWTYSW